MTVQIGLSSGALRANSLERATIVTTVQEKVPACPMYARFFNKSRERLVRLAGKYAPGLGRTPTGLAPVP